MAAYSYAEPAIYMPGGFKEPDVQPFAATPAAGIKRGDIVTIAAGLLTRPTGAVGTGIATSGIVGLTEMDQTAIYYVGIGGSAAIATPSAANSALFGATTAGTALQPGLEFQGTKVVLAHNGQQFEFSLNSAVTWATSLIGTQVGIALDGTSNLYIADTTATNKVGVIVGEVDGPNKGAVGDTGKRIIVALLASVLAV